MTEPAKRWTTRRGAVLAGRDGPGLAEQAEQPGGVCAGSRVVAPDQVAQRQAGLEALGGGESEAGHGLGEAGDIGQGQLGVEEALVEQLGRRTVGQGAGIGELGVDHQGGLIEPDELAVQAAGVPRAVPGVVEQLERQGGYLAGAGAYRSAGCARSALAWRG